MQMRDMFLCVNMFVRMCVCVCLGVGVSEWIWVFVRGHVIANEIKKTTFSGGSLKIVDEI